MPLRTYRGDPFFVYNSSCHNRLAETPYWVLSHIGAICGKFRTFKHARIAARELNLASVRGEFTSCNLNEWKKSYLLGDTEVMDLFWTEYGGEG